MEGLKGVTFDFGLSAAAAHWRSSWRPVVAVLALVVAAAGTPLAGESTRADNELVGKLLVATPEMPDPRFAETVIFMVEHSTSGAMGLVLNRPMGKIPVASLLDELGIEGISADGEIRLHYGGPVALGTGLVLHSADYKGTDTLVVTDAVSLTAEREIVRAIATGDGPRRILVAFGYAGWAAGQLEAEIASGGWITVPSDDSLVFDDDYDAKWERAMKRHAIDL